MKPVYYMMGFDMRKSMIVGVLIVSSSITASAYAAADALVVFAKGVATQVASEVIIETGKYVANNPKEAARYGTYGGAAAGTVGGIAAISTAGTVAGLSGAGITSGLAALGGGTIAAGGLGIAGGTLVVLAAPIVAAVGLGTATYWLFSEPPKPKERTWGDYWAGN